MPKIRIPYSVDTNVHLVRTAIIGLSISPPTTLALADIYAGWCMEKQKPCVCRRTRKGIVEMAQDYVLALEPAREWDEVGIDFIIEGEAEREAAALAALEVAMSPYRGKMGFGNLHAHARGLINVSLSLNGWRGYCKTLDFGSKPDGIRMMLDALAKSPVRDDGEIRRAIEELESKLEVAQKNKKPILRPIPGHWADGLIWVASRLATGGWDDLDCLDKMLDALAEHPGRESLEIQRAVAKITELKGEEEE